MHSNVIEPMQAVTATPITTDAIHSTSNVQLNDIACAPTSTSTSTPSTDSSMNDIQSPHHVTNPTAVLSPSAATPKETNPPSTPQIDTSPPTKNGTNPSSSKSAPNIVTKARGQRPKKSSSSSSTRKGHGFVLRYSYWNPRPKNKCIGTSEKPIYVLFDDESAKLYDCNEANKCKYSICWELIKSYHLHHESQYGHKVRIIAPVLASRDDLLSYHDEDYITTLEDIENFPEYSSQTEEEKESLREYGLMDDSPIFDGLHHYCLTVAGGSLQCAQLLKSKRTRIAIHFGGGRHHAFSSRANGHCYVNDIILCIDSLRSEMNGIITFKKVLYLDLDLHHCDAVQDAYYDCDDVFVASIHEKDTDFFPQTGDRSQCGGPRAPFHNLNVAVCGWKMGDDAFCDIISKICHRINYYFQPDAVVICAGADGLQSDPFRRWNLSINGLAKGVQTVLTQIDVPTVILGGGGYNAIDTAKCWTKIVSIAAGITIPNEIPFHQNFSKFAPNYLLHKMCNDGDRGEEMRTDAIIKGEEADDGKRKRIKTQIQSMQLIYGHLNSFERLFVENNLISSSSSKATSTSNHKMGTKKSEDMESKRSEEKRKNMGRARREKWQRQRIRTEEKEKEHTMTETETVSTGVDEQMMMGKLAIRSTESENVKVLNADRLKRPLGDTGTTNACRSRRKRRKIIGM